MAARQLRARPEDILARFPLRPQQPANSPPLGILSARDVDLLGRRALLSIERIAPGRVRATVAVRALGQFATALTLGREVAEEAHRLGRQALEELGVAPTAAGIWGVGFTVEGTES